VIESPLLSPDRDAIVAAIEENLFALAPLFRHLPGAESGAGPEGRWTVTDVAFPFFNSILGTDVDAAGADATIERALARARRRRVPVLWWTGPRTRPRDLGARLERHGFARDDEAPGMALELARLPAAAPPPPALTVERVESGAALAAFVATFRQGFGIDAAFERPWVNWLATLGLGDGAPMRHWLARWEGEPVGTATVLLAAGVAGVYNVATLPAARRRGVGAATTRAALVAARERDGCAWSILHSSPMGLRVYRSLGFREYCRIGVYFWMG
jgi:ribosomal protein S18 acetylase RimI-like enzyme